MSEINLAAEPMIGLPAFLGVLIAMALRELAAPRRRREIPRVIRWMNNLALVVLDTATLRLTFPFIAVGLAVMAANTGLKLHPVEILISMGIITSGGRLPQSVEKFARKVEGWQTGLPKPSKERYH